MDKKQLIEYLKRRIECTQAYLCDLYNTSPNDIEVVKAEIELDVLLDILNECLD